MTETGRIPARFVWGRKLTIRYQASMRVNGCLLAKHLQQIPPRTNATRQQNHRLASRVGESFLMPHPDSPSVASAGIGAPPRQLRPSCCRSTALLVYAKEITLRSTFAAPAPR